MPDHPPRAHERKNVLYALLAWVGVLNLPFLVLSYFFSFDRGASILLYIALFLAFAIMMRSGLMARHPILARLLIYGLVLGILSLELFRFAYYFFGLRGPEMLQALPMVLRLNPASYPLYLGFGIGFILSFVAFIYFSSKGTIRRKRDMIAVAIPLLALAVGDVLYNKTLFFKSKLAFGLDAIELEERRAFAMAVNANAVLPAHLENGGERDLLIVVVEALGALKNEEINDLLFAPLQTAEVQDKFSIKRGTIPYHGSTTAAEMRELCGSEHSYLDILSAQFDPSECLPNQLSKKGYRTTSYHGFFGEMFERQDWYPKIGFEKSKFLEDLVKENAALETSGYCGGTFKGACDKKVADMVFDDVTSAKQKSFTYWLTLNSHFPAVRHANYGRPFNCSKFQMEQDNQICIMSEYWTEVFEKVRSIALFKKARPIDIIVVGDHAPPLLWRDDREQFQPGLVPYIALKQKNADHVLTTASTAKP